MDVLLVVLFGLVFTYAMTVTIEKLDRVKRHDKPKSRENAALPSMPPNQRAVDNPCLTCEHRQNSIAFAARLKAAGELAEDSIDHDLEPRIECTFHPGFGFEETSVAYCPDFKPRYAGNVGTYTVRMPRASSASNTFPTRDEVKETADRLARIEYAKCHDPKCPRYRKHLCHNLNCKHPRRGI